MIRYYHITPKEKISSILKRGLLTRDTEKVMAEGTGEKTGGKVFLGRNKGECFDQLTSEPYSEWAIFAVDLPDDWPLYLDEWNYIYSRRSIPPKYLTLLGTERTMTREEMTQFLEFLEAQR